MALAAANASAQTVINITGATAFRTAAHHSIIAALGGPGTAEFAYSGTDAAGATRAIYSGNIGVTPVIVRTSWSGSTAGIADLATGATQTFLNDDEGIVDRTVAGNPSQTALEPDVVHFAFSDVEKTISNHATATLGGGPVGVVPFRWVASKTPGTPHGVLNITDQQVEALFSTGQLPLSVFTGLVADDPVATPLTGRYVLPFGRNDGSGTRATALAETKYGPFRTLSQYGADTTISGSGSGITMTNAGTLGNGGQSSGGSLRNFLSANTETVMIGAQGPFSVVGIGYLSISDSNTAISQGGIELAYNGVFYSVDNVTSGRYTFWGYQQLYHLPVLSPAQQAFDTALRASIPANIGTAGIAISAMKVTRGGGDGGLVSP